MASTRWPAARPWTRSPGAPTLGHLIADHAGGRGTSGYSPCAASPREVQAGRPDTDAHLARAAPWIGRLPHSRAPGPPASDPDRALPFSAAARPKGPALARPPPDPAYPPRRTGTARQPQFHTGTSRQPAHRPGRATRRGAGYSSASAAPAAGRATSCWPPASSATRPPGKGRGRVRGGGRGQSWAMNMVTPPVAKFGTSAPAAWRSGDSAAAAKTS